MSQFLFMQIEKNNLITNLAGDERIKRQKSDFLFQN